MDAPALHPMDDALQLTSLGGRHFQGRIPERWANFIGPFGGILAASFVKALEAQPDRIGDPLALTVNFGGPVADAPFELQVEPTRTNRSSQHWRMSLIQGEETPLTATAITGTRRDSWEDQEAHPPAAPAPDTLAVVPSEIAPSWVANYDMRIARGPLSIMNANGQPSEHSESLLWVRDQPPRALDFPALAAMGDVFFPRIYVRRADLVPVGTVTLSTYFHADSQELKKQADGFVLARARANRFRGGYFDQSGELWSTTGQLLASTHQMVYFKH